MELTLSENPRGLPRHIIKRFGVTKRGWAEYRKERAGGRRRNPRKKTAKRMHARPRVRRKRAAPAPAHHRAYSGAIARPTLHRVRAGLYGRTPISRQRAPSVHVQNRRHRRRHIYRNPVLGNVVMDTGKVLVGFMALNAMTNLTLTGINKVTTIPTTTTPYVKAGVRIGYAILTRKYAARIIGPKCASDLFSFTVTYTAFQVLMQLMQSSTATANAATYIGAYPYANVGAVVLSPGTNSYRPGVGRIMSRQLQPSMSALFPSDGSRTTAAELQGA